MFASTALVVVSKDGSVSDWYSDWPGSVNHHEQYHKVDAISDTINFITSSCNF